MDQEAFLDLCTQPVSFSEAWHEVLPPYQVVETNSGELKPENAPPLCQKVWLDLLRHMIQPPKGSVPLGGRMYEFGVHAAHAVDTENGPTLYLLPPRDEMEYTELVKRLGALSWWHDPNQPLPPVLSELIPDNRKRKFKEPAIKLAEKNVLALIAQRKAENEKRESQGRDDYLPELTQTEIDDAGEIHYAFHWDVLARNYLTEVLFTPLFSGAELYSPVATSTRQMLKHFRAKQDARAKKKTGIPNHREFLRAQLHRPAFLPELEKELYTKTPQVIALQSLRASMHLVDIARRSNLWFEFEPQVVLGGTPGGIWNGVKGLLRRYTHIITPDEKAAARTFWNFYDDDFNTHLREQIDWDYTLQKRIRPTLADAEGAAFLATLPLGGWGGTLLKAGRVGGSFLKVSGGLVLKAAPFAVPATIIGKELLRSPNEDEKPQQRLFIRFEENSEELGQPFIWLQHGVLRWLDTDNGPQAFVIPSSVFFLPTNSVFQDEDN